MPTLLHSAFAGPNIVRRLLNAASVLRASGVDASVKTGRRAAELNLDGVNALFSQNEIPDSVRTQFSGPCWGGRQLSRQASLSLLAELQTPVMEWQTGAAKTTPDLFAEWQVERLLVKRSWTSNDNGLQVLRIGQTQFTQWDTAFDVVCREVNPQDGTLWKAEIFGGQIILAWKANKPPLADRIIVDTDYEAQYGFCRLKPSPPTVPWPRGYRERVTYPQAEADMICALSRELTARGFGYCSLDMMRRPDGKLVAIELNTSSVAMWWGETFPDVRGRFAQALLHVIKAH
jgi:hypothetical protein